MPLSYLPRPLPLVVHPRHPPQCSLQKSHISPTHLLSPYTYALFDISTLGRKQNALSFICEYKLNLQAKLANAKFLSCTIVMCCLRSSKQNEQSIYFYPAIIMTIFKEKAYCGYRVQGKEFKEYRKCKRVPKESRMAT